VPCGFTAEGLPIGVQMLGKPLDEATLLRAGHVIESTLALAKKPKGLA
jgi:aspartyl-tRNA(Asn)/glutamyl-tRNA(Gln) amidotransferase subunit A